MLARVLLKTRKAVVARWRRSQRSVSRAGAMRRFTKEASVFRRIMKELVGRK